jgi:MraZ protein
MLRFSAICSALIDDKRRVVLPASFKKAMGDLAEEPLVIEKDPYKPCLNIYPQQIWNKKLDDLENRLNPFNESDDELLELVYENYVEITMAPNGRINIPEDFMEYALFSKEDREVRFTGKGPYIKLWNDKIYQERLSSRRKIGDLYRERFGHDSQND